ncbi:MAG: GNAT family N-acetyltransferase [Propionibacterium sp.]|nr:GNAT family N-acetyltransferase [Propionibacterium sp.]
MAFVLIYVRPEHRRRGIGQRLVATLEDAVRELAPARLTSWVTTPVPEGATISPAHGVGAVRADHDGVKMALREGFTLAQVERVSRYDFDRPLVDPHEALATARAAAGESYELIVWAGAAPSDMCDDLARLTERMSRDVPSGGLTVVEESWDAQRIRKRDRDILIGNRLYRAVARHVGSGAIVALNELVRNRSNEQAYVDQWDTVVLPEHRGHRLGMLVKAANLIQVREAEPSATAVLTWNAEENRYMLSVNESLGFREILREAAFEKLL